MRHASSSSSAARAETRAPSSTTPSAPIAVGLLATALLLALSACGGDGASSASAVMVQDSAGVQIITNPGAGAWSADEAWNIEEELRIGVAEGDPELQFGMLVGVDADAEGRIVTLDQQGARVRVFGADGELLHAFGRAGGGPGELSQALSPATGVFYEADGSIAIPDMGNLRLARFSPTGQSLDSPRLAIEATGIPILFSRTADRDLVVQYRQMAIPGAGAMGGDDPSGDRIVRLAPASAEGDALVEVPAGETFSMGAGGMPQFRIFAPEPVWAILSDGRVVTGTNNEYSLTLHPTGGAAAGPDARAGSGRTIVRRTVDRIPVTDRQQTQMRNLFRQSFEDSGQPIPQEVVEQLVGSMEFESHWPVLAAVLPGPDGTLWVQRVEAGARLEELTIEALQAGEFGSRRWDVFDSEGTYMGAVNMPEGVQPLRFVGDRLYGIHSDDLRIQRAVRLRVNRGG
ncbi:MAG: hypothetical protein EA350_06550 [Gemmatimonadales bacterium]|nr:MAG: hypothetical protein EA350_06550 [Gemmatimonadales bacterium]